MSLEAVRLVPRRSAKSWPLATDRDGVLFPISTSSAGSPVYPRLRYWHGPCFR